MKSFVRSVTTRVSIKVIVRSESGKKPTRRARADLTMVVVDVHSTTPTKR